MRPIPSSAGKGDEPRTIPGRKYRDNFDAIFGRRALVPTPRTSKRKAGDFFQRARSYAVRGVNCV